MPRSLELHPHRAKQVRLRCATSIGSLAANGPKRLSRERHMQAPERTAAAAHTLYRSIVNAGTSFVLENVQYFAGTQIKCICDLFQGCVNEDRLLLVEIDPVVCCESKSCLKERDIRGLLRIYRAICLIYVIEPHVLGALYNRTGNAADLNLHVHTVRQPDLLRCRNAHGAVGALLQADRSQNNSDTETGALRIPDEDLSKGRACLHNAVAERA